jgi:hypothetical protein
MVHPEEKIIVSFMCKEELGGPKEPCCPDSEKCERGETHPMCMRPDAI